MRVVGIAIVGKRNEPLYLCDCTKLGRSNNNYNGDDEDDFDVSALHAADVAVDGDDHHHHHHHAHSNDPLTAWHDIPAFLLPDHTDLPQRHSLSVEHQVLMHAALDTLDEWVGPSQLDGSMPVRGFYANNMAPTTTQTTTNATTQQTTTNTVFTKWLGLLTLLDAIWPVYGYVTATNIKFLALCQTTAVDNDHHPDNHDTVAKAEHVVTQQRVKTLLAKLHVYYVRYVLNPFSAVAPGHGPIDSPRFDAHFRQAVAEFYGERPPVPTHSSTVLPNNNHHDDDDQELKTSGE